MIFYLLVKRSSHFFLSSLNRCETIGNNPSYIPPETILLCINCAVYENMDLQSYRIPFKGCMMYQ